MTKQEVRKQIKEKLSSISARELEASSEKLCNLIIHSKAYKDCSILLAYMPLGDEVNITPVIEDALSQNKSVYLPRIIPGTNQMDFYRYTTTTYSAAGTYGIIEPEQDETRNLLRHLEVDPPLSGQIFMLVPGRAFTKEGKRLGRGKGFYDIYFSRLAALGFSEGIKKSGVCFACQLLADLPTTPDDVLMDTVVSTPSTSSGTATTAHTISGE